MRLAIVFLSTLLITVLAFQVLEFGVAGHFANLSVVLWSLAGGLYYASLWLVVAPHIRHWSLAAVLVLGAASYPLACLLVFPFGWYFAALLAVYSWWPIFLIAGMVAGLVTWFLVAETRPSAQAHLFLRGHLARSARS